MLALAGKAEVFREMCISGEEGNSDTMNALRARWLGVGVGSMERVEPMERVEIVQRERIRNDR